MIDVPKMVALHTLTVIQFLLTITIAACTLETASAQNWEGLVESANKRIVFDEFGDTVPKWPRVRSLNSPTARSRADGNRQKAFHTIAHRIIDDTRQVVVQMPMTPLSELWRRLNVMLTLRDAVLADPGYADVVLADALTRGVAVALCHQMGNTPVVSSEYEEVLSRLLQFKVDRRAWVVLAQEELGFSNERLQEIDNEPQDARAYRSMWKLMSDDGDFDLPENVTDSASHRLLKRSDPGLMLRRYLHTDIFLKTLLLAIEYKKKAREFSLDATQDDIEHIIPSPAPTSRDIVTKSGRLISESLPLDPTRYSLGERVLQLQVSYPEVFRLLQQIKRGDIDRQLFFDVEDTRE